MLISVRIQEGLRTLLPYTIVKGQEGDTIYDVIDGIINKNLGGTSVTKSPALQRWVGALDSSFVTATVGKQSETAVLFRGLLYSFDTRKCCLMCKSKKKNCRKCTDLKK